MVTHNFATARNYNVIRVADSNLHPSFVQFAPATIMAMQAMAMGCSGMMGMMGIYEAAYRRAQAMVIARQQPVR